MTTSNLTCQDTRRRNTCRCLRIGRAEDSLRVKDMTKPAGCFHNEQQQISLTGLRGTNLQLRVAQSHVSDTYNWDWASGLF